jgi:tetratricopeptide (TPR) repeat protein
VRAACLSLIASVAVAGSLGDSGFEHFYNLEYDEALNDFRAEASRDPSSADALNHIATAILFRAMFRAGSVDTDLIGAANSFLRRPKLPLDAADQAQFSDAVNRAIRLSEPRVKANPRDLPAMYALGVSYGVRANYHFLVKKAWLDALSDTAAARKMENRVIEIDPDFTDARLILGVHEYVVASLPWALRAVSAVAGVTGDREHAIAALHGVALYGNTTRYDAQALLAAIYRREKRPREALEMLNMLLTRFPRAYLLRLEIAEACADSGGRAQALAAVEEVDRLKKSGAPGYARVPPARIRYTRGDVLFTFRDLDPAFEEMKSASEGWRDLDPVTAGLAWLRLGQIYDLKGRRQEAIAAYRESAIASPGSDAASEAHGYLSSPFRK